MPHESEGYTTGPPVVRDFGNPRCLVHGPAQDHHRLDHGGAGRPLAGLPAVGRYGSVSEIVRAALRLLDRDEAPALRSVRARADVAEAPRDR
ncbi:type II toxin-antitoxin system ParD family antitoxin [Methylobacterium sp. E-065]|uniref:type II toxin-antitoxin system ParD family antitoxin n=1 Tax=Methylobacterium sp. E-065 TaxID=2836583 RepID=UPI00391C519F